MQTEQRISSRMLLSQQAKITLDNAEPIGCTIRDQSKNGFALAVNSVLGIPNTFTLVLPDTGETFEARIVWKKPGKIGVAVQRV